MICSMRLMNYHYYDAYHELNTRGINRLYHSTITIVRKLSTRLKQVILGFKVTNWSVKLILWHSCAKLQFCLIIISKIIFKCHIRSQHQINPSQTNSMSIKSFQNKLNPQVFIEPIMIIIYKTSLTIDLTMLKNNSYTCTWSSILNNMESHNPKYSFLIIFQAKSSYNRNTNLCSQNHDIYLLLSNIVLTIFLVSQTKTIIIYKSLDY